MSAQFADIQTEIYRGGLYGRRPDLPLNPRTLEERARDVLDPVAWDFLAGGAGIEESMRANREAFERWRIVPRMLRDITSRTLATRLLGAEIPAPVMVAPIGVQSMFSPEGELATARAAAADGIPMIVSTVSSRTLEEIARTDPTAPRWFQLYWPDDPDLTASLLHRAAAAGYRAVVITVDNALLGWRPRELAAAYMPYLQGLGLANYFSDPAFCAALPRPPEDDPHAALSHFAKVFSRPSLTWRDLAHMRELTQLPIVLKGILSSDDVLLAENHGVDAVCVSNHGGRQIDGEVAALDALAEITDHAVGLPILFDSGIRSGADCFKAIALGAAAVLVGRPVMWGLTLGHQLGVTAVLRNILAELELTAALAGCANIADVNRDALTRA